MDIANPVFDWSNGNEQKISLRPWFTRARVESAFERPLLLTPTGRPPAEERFYCFSEVEGQAVVVIFTIRNERVAAYGEQQD